MSEHEKLRTHRFTMLNMCFLVLCLCCSWLTILVTIMSIGDSHSISIGGITTTNKYENGEVVTFTMTIPHFDMRYCHDEGTLPEVCVIVPNLASAEYMYKLLLVLNLMVVCYLMLNLYFTGFRERVPKFFTYNYMHFLYPFSYALGSILYFTISKAFTTDFSLEYGFYQMVCVAITAFGSALFNKFKINTFADKEKEEEQQQPLLSN